MWRKISATISGCLLGSACFLSACDKGSDNSAPATGNPTPVKVPLAPPHPTTQQLTSGPRTNLYLKYVPLSLMVPEGFWKCSTTGMDGENPEVLLEGPTPSDDVRFRVAVARTIKGENTDPKSPGNQEKPLEAHANAMAKLHPELFNGPAVREINGAKVIEQLSMSELSAPTAEELKDLPASATQPAKPGMQVTAIQAAQLVQWTFTVCVPTGNDFTAYDLTTSMSLTQFNADRDFVRAIMDTLKYSPSQTDVNIH